VCYCLLSDWDGSNQCNGCNRHLTLIHLNLYKYIKLKGVRPLSKVSYGLFSIVASHPPGTVPSPSNSRDAYTEYTPLWHNKIVGSPVSASVHMCFSVGIFLWIVKSLHVTYRNILWYTDRSSLSKFNFARLTLLHLIGALPGECDLEFVSVVPYFRERKRFLKF